MNRFLTLALIIPLVITACGPSKDPKNASFIVASGKGFKITRGELDKERDTQLKGMGVTADKLTPEQSSFFDNRVVNMMITRSIVLSSSASLKGGDLSKKADEEIAKIINQFPSQEAFAQKLKENGMTTGSLKKTIEEDLLAQKFIESKIDKDSISVNPADVEKFYKEHGDFWKVPEHVKMRQISVKIAPDATKEVHAEKKKAIDAARARVAKGEKFETVCSEVSEDMYKAQGGVCPPVARGQIPPDVEKAIFVPKVGTLTAVFTSPGGLHFAEIMEHNPARVRTLEEVSGDITTQLAGEKRRVAVNALIEDLRNKAEVKIFLPAPEVPKPSQSKELSSGEKAAPAPAKAPEKK